MLYDYIITQYYPMIFFYFCISAGVIGLASSLYFAGIPNPHTRYGADERREYFKKWRTKYLTVLVANTLHCAFLVWLPDVEYVKYYFGDVRTLTTEQQRSLQAQYDKHYEKSRQLLIDCLEKGQKQPHTTTFNDTNEVVKTCYNVAKYKF